jgi:tRNA A-37 threonylcarbamoyl transferase component Bud32
MDYATSKLWKAPPDNAFLHRELEEIVEKIVQDQDSYFEEGRVVRFRPVEFIQRPSSKIVKVEVEFENSKNNILVKFFKSKNYSLSHLHMLRERIRRDFEVTRSVYERFKRYSGYSAAVPIACFPELLAIVMVESQGQNLRDLIIKKATFYPRKDTLDQLAEYSFACGQWLTIFQAITEEKAQGKLQPRDVIKDIDLRLSKLVQKHGNFFNSQLRRQVLNYLERQASLVTDRDLRLCGVHGDFCPSNILIDGKEIIALDFEMFKVGSPYQDVTYYLRHLETFLQKPTFRPKTISILRQAFLSGYGKGIDATSPSFNVFKLRHVICHLVDILDASGQPFHKRLFNNRIARRYIQRLKDATVDCYQPIISDLHIPLDSTR